MSSTGDDVFDGILLGYCGKYKALSGAPNDHTTDIHDVALLAESSFSKHPSVMQKSFNHTIF